MPYSENRAFAIFGRDAQSKNLSVSWRFTPSRTRGAKSKSRSLVASLLGMTSRPIDRAARAACGLCDLRVSASSV